MNLKGYLQIVRRRWVVLPVFLILGVAGSTLWTATRQPAYEAKAEAFVAVRDGTGETSAAYQGGLFTQERVKSYLQIVTTPLVLDPALQKTRIPLTVDQLASKIVASAPLETVIIEISVVDGDPKRAAILANAVVEKFAQIVPSLEATGTNSMSPVTVTILRHATEPGHPSSPSVKLNLALGILAGIFLGTLAAFLWESLDTAVRNEESVLDAADLPTLGIIVHDPAVKSRPVKPSSHGYSARAEGFKSLRTNLKFVDIGNPIHSIVVTSANAGEGKSVTAINLALSLAQAGDRVVLLEADLRRPTFSKYLGVESATGLTNLLIGTADIYDVIQPWGESGMKVVASGPIPPNPSELLASKGMKALLSTLYREFDYVVIDAPPLLPVTDGVILSAIADATLLVVHARRTKKDQLTGAVRALKKVDARVLGVTLNQVKGRGPEARSYSRPYVTEWPSGSGKDARADSFDQFPRKHAKFQEESPEWMTQEIRRDSPGIVPGRENESISRWA